MSSERPARVRATHSQGTVHVLQALEPQLLPAVLARLEPAVRRGLLEAQASERIPAAWDVALVRAEVEVLGREGMRRVARATMVDALGGPQLGGLVSAALRLFGATPPGLFRWAGRAWGHVTEGCGELRLERAEASEAWLILEGMPGELADREYLEAVAGTLEAPFDVCRMDGEVSVVPRPSGGRFHARWRARRARPARPARPGER
jgi:hypothetical protein